MRAPLSILVKKAVSELKKKGRHGPTFSLYIILYLHTVQRKLYNEAVL